MAPSHPALPGGEPADRRFRRHPRQAPGRGWALHPRDPGRYQLGASLPGASRSPSPGHPPDLRRPARRLARHWSIALRSLPDTGASLGPRALSRRISCAATRAISYRMVIGCAGEKPQRGAGTMMVTTRMGALRANTCAESLQGRWGSVTIETVEMVTD